MEKVFFVNIRYKKEPKKKDINQKLLLLGNALGLFSARDKDKSRFRIFISLLKARKRGILLSSDQLAHTLHLTRGTVVHHLHELMDQGIVVIYDGRYTLRSDSIKGIVEKIEEDVVKMMSNVKRLAKEIDNEME